MMVAATRTVVRPAQFEPGNLLDWISEPKMVVASAEKKEPFSPWNRGERERRVTIDGRSKPFK